jgi:glycine C-acetyltransferase
MLKDVLAARLAELEHSGLYRRLRLIEGAQEGTVALNGREVLMLSSNNYLGLANHPTLKHAAQAAIEQFGCGAGASRLISGTMELHQELEHRLAQLKHTEAALAFPTGYHANVGTLSALMAHGDTILSDALNHASIIDGCRLSNATTFVFRHNDMEHLAELLASCSGSGDRLIVVDSVFSMDGDIAPLREITTLARRYDAWVMVDEAHATGVFGPHGSGVVEELGLNTDIDIQMGTLGKALGGFGAYVAGRRELIEWLVNRARSFIYTTGLPPSVAATAIAALDIVKQEPERRQQLWDNTALLTKELSGLGYTLGESRSQILPVIIGDAGQTMALAAALLTHGIFAQGIRPPTVPAGTSRIRLTSMATHTTQDMQRTVQAFAAAGKEVGLLS